ncbi:hypothetical protein MUN88_20050 [Gracilibacillus caseinilyticus]|uniref:LXG domain of WXG superfamily protein n=1 Tax=Gracilibacillus caseinilyticus TaxID=2932256 RepID=A0ABY4EWQ6_9BACI|nr:hypothetical protein [Gracilibacillus caseinilyticus]UOQ48302.1 hypothetical protein MUN88_20050 [Gracilibacillus caseinilyticus]
MKFVLNNDENSFNSQAIKNTEEVIENINKYVGEEHILSHLIIDNQEVYNNMESYIDKYFHRIDTIQIITKTTVQFINDTFITAEEYISNALPQLEKLIDQFYNNPTAADWHHFKQFTDGLQWLSDMLVNIDTLKERPTNWQVYVSVYHELEGQVHELAEGVENQDHTLIADVINFEIKPLYERLKHLITNTIDSEGSRPNAN